MPQLDQVTFFSQFFWLCFFFFTFYAVLLKSFLPKMNRILRFRKKIHQASSDSYVGEYQSLLQNYHTARIPEIRTSTDHLSKVLGNTRNWVDSTLLQLNQSNEQNKQMNRIYVRSIGEITISQTMMTTGFDLVFPPIQTSQNTGVAKQKLYAQRILNRLKKKATSR